MKARISRGVNCPYCDKWMVTLKNGKQLFCDDCNVYFEFPEIDIRPIPAKPKYTREQVLSMGHDELDRVHEKLFTPEWNNSRQHKDSHIYHDGIPYHPSTNAQQAIEGWESVRDEHGCYHVTPFCSRSNGSRRWYMLDIEEQAIEWGPMAEADWMPLPELLTRAAIIVKLGL